MPATIPIDEAYSLFESVCSLDDPIWVYKDNPNCSLCGQHLAPYWEETTPAKLIEELPWDEDIAEVKIRYYDEDGVAWEGHLLSMFLERVDYQAADVKKVKGSIDK